MKKSKLITLLIFIFILNLTWEFAHYNLYIDLTNIPSTIHLIIASLTDLVLISLIFLIISVFRKGVNWMESPKKLDYVIIVVLGMVIATIIETYSLSQGRWAYTELMPIVFGIGISPLIQLFTTGIISLVLIRKIKDN